MKIVLLVAFAAVAVLAQSVTYESVRTACLQTYFNGMTAEIASTLGPAAVPFLHQLLNDETFPRHDNVVAFLTYLGNGASTSQLVAYTARPQAAKTTVPEQYRAFLLVPHALGHMAARNVNGALAALNAYLHSPVGFGAAELAGEAVYGLAFASAYDEIFSAVTSAQASKSDVSSAIIGAFSYILQDPVPASVLQAYPVLSKFNVQAASANAQGGNGGKSVDVLGVLDFMQSLSPNPAGAKAVSPLTTHSITFCNHVSTTNKMTVATLTTVLAAATSYIKTKNFATDVACDASMVVSGSAGSFGSVGDGLATINTNAALNSVLNNGCGRVKVVNAINYCGGSSGTNIIGCGWVGANGMSLVRLSNTNSEAILWAHEYGHNLGLNHHSASNNIMYAYLNTGGGLDSSQCSKYNPPPPPPPCFALDATVEVKDKGAVRIDSLKEGDLVADGSEEVYSPFITYLHHDNNASAPFVVISAEGLSRPLVLTVEHYVFIVNSDGKSVSVRADQVSVGDLVEIGGGRTSKVIKIQRRTQSGFTAPMTESGKMLVDGIVASCYSDQETSHETGVTVMKPLVWLSKMFPSLARHDVSHNDIHWYAKVLIQLAKMRDNVNDKLNEFRSLFPARP